MSIPRQDWVATLLIGTATLIYGLWLAGPLGGLSSSAIAMLVLVLGFIASASAVVPGFAALIAGSKLYLGMASIGGVVALMSGVLTVAQATEQTLTVLMVTTLGLWAAATVRHALAARQHAPAIG